MSSDLDSLQNLSITNKELNLFLKDKYVLEQLSIHRKVPVSDSLLQLKYLSTQSIGKRLIFAVTRNDYASTLRMLKLRHPQYQIRRDEYETSVTKAKNMGHEDIVLLLEEYRLPLLKMFVREVIDKSGNRRRIFISATDF